MAHPEGLTQLDPTRPSPESPPLALPRYGIRDDEMTKPSVVLVDWSVVDDAAAVAHPPEEIEEAFEVLADEDVREFADDDQLPDDDELEEDPDDAFDNAFAPRWRGVGRKPGAVALAVLLTFCLGIGLVALFGPSDAHAGAASGAADIALR